MHLHNYFHPKDSAPSETFKPDQLYLEGQWVVAILEFSQPSVYQNVRDGEIVFFLEKLSKSSEFFYPKPGLYPSITDIVETMNTLTQERHNHS